MSRYRMALAKARAIIDLLQELAEAQSEADPPDVIASRFDMTRKQAQTAIASAKRRMAEHDVRVMDEIAKNDLDDPLHRMI